MAPEAEPRRAFVWPPAATEAVASAARAVTPQPASPRGGFGAAIARWAHAAEEFWLEPTALPLARRMAQCGWAPDVFGAFCDRCGRTVGPHEGDEFGCSGCRGTRLPWARFVRLGAHEGDLRQWVHEVKFTRWRRLGADLGAMLGDRVAAAGLGPGIPGRPQRLCVAPMPTTWRRLAERGVDHAGAIAEGVARRLRAPLVRALRRRHRPSQVEVTASQRLRNVSGAFRPVWGVDLSGWTVVLVDDVRTTGATLRAASRALGRMQERRPAEIWCAAVAVARDPGEAPHPKIG